MDYVCPFAAIQLSINDKKCYINHDSSYKADGDWKTRQKQARLLRTLPRKVCFSNISQQFANTYSSDLKRHSKRIPDISEIIVRNTLINSGIPCGVNVHGNNHMRIEFFAQCSEKFIIGESDITELETLAISRRILDDIAVLINRYKIPKDSIIPIGVLNGLANKRTDFYEVIEDIHNVLGIQISLITYHILFLLNLFHISLSDKVLSSFIVNRTQNTLLSQTSILIEDLKTIDANLESSCYETKK